MSVKFTLPSPSSDHNSAEEIFLKNTGIDSADPLVPHQRDAHPSINSPPLRDDLLPDESPSPATNASLDALAPDPIPHIESTTNILIPFSNITLNFNVKIKTSSYHTSAYMMYYILHLINKRLVDNHYFKKDCDDYHPYFLRLYFGILYYIQILRARSYASLLTNEEDQFLKTFLDSFPPETLPIPGPLLTLFQSICASQPEYPNYGLLVPNTPAAYGPDKARDLIPPNALNYLLPNIQGIFGLITALSNTVAANPSTPPEQGYIPVTGTSATNFANHAFGLAASWTNNEAFYLVTPGLEYSCEAPHQLNREFNKTTESIDIPPIGPTTNISGIIKYLNMHINKAWFSRLRSIAVTACAYIDASSTLAACSPSGYSANQVVVLMTSPTTPSAKPTKMSDPASILTFGYSLASSNQRISPLMQFTAAASQINVRMPQNHPFLAICSDAVIRSGPFWQILPVLFSTFDSDCYKTLRKEIDSMIELRL